MKASAVPARLVFGIVAAMLAAAPAAATSVHNYADGEYATIGGGVSPDGAFSIAAHGKGEFGDEDFHLYLMAEPGHKKIGPLEEVNEILDTGPEAFEAEWSADSRHVALLYRSDRHIRTLTLYRIEHSRAFAVNGPLLLTAVAGKGVTSAKDFDLRTRRLAVTWLSPSRFKLEETEIFATGSSTVASKAATFGKSDQLAPDDDGSHGGYMVSFAAAADCDLGPHDTFKPGKLTPGDLPDEDDE